MTTTPQAPSGAQAEPVDLLSCPFCGKDHTHLEKQFGDESGYIRCRNCGAQSGRMFWTSEEIESDDFSASEATAIAAWNRRASPAPVAPAGVDIKPVAVVLENLDGNEARIRYLFNPVPIGAELHWDHGDLLSVLEEVERRDAAPSPAEAPAGEAVRPDEGACSPDEYRSVIGMLGKALKRLTFAARTSGGTAGPDAELMAACDQAEEALTLKAMSVAADAAPPQAVQQPLSEEQIEGLMPTPDGTAEANVVRLEVLPGVMGTEYEEVDAWSLPLVVQAIRAVEEHHGIRAAGTAADGDVEV